MGSTTTLAEIDIGISIDVSKYIFLGAILISFLLLFWDIRKGRTIVASRDISYTFTSVFASRYYSLKDYNYYCFFCKIQNSKKTTDEIAFFVFFTLKGKEAVRVFSFFRSGHFLLESYRRTGF